MGYYIDGNGVYHGFLRAPDGSITKFNPPGAGKGAGQGTYTQIGMNPKRVITGGYWDSSSVIHGFLRARDGKFTRFDAPSTCAGSGAGQGSAGYSINPAGLIVGGCTDDSGVAHAFLRHTDGTFKVFDDPDAGTGAGQGTTPDTSSGLSPAGVVSGFYIDSNSVYHGFLRASDGTFTSVDAQGAGTGAGQGTLLASINPKGVTAGVWIDSNNVNHSFVRTPDGTITEFDVKGAGTGAGQGTIAQSINPAGAIPGYYIDANSVLHGFLRAPDGTTTKFDVLGQAGTLPTSNNPAGAITGVYFDANGAVHGFLRP
jgi:hypothetical protein